MISKEKDTTSAMDSNTTDATKQGSAYIKKYRKKQEHQQLAVLHWNENVDLPYTSIWTPPEAQLIPILGPRKPKGEKVVYIYVFI